MTPGCGRQATNPAMPIHSQDPLSRYQRRFSKSPEVSTVYKVDFASIPWTEGRLGVRFKTYREGNKQLRLVEFTTGDGDLTGAKSVILVTCLLAA